MNAAATIAAITTLTGNEARCQFGKWHDRLGFTCGEVSHLAVDTCTGATRLLCADAAAHIRTSNRIGWYTCPKHRDQHHVEIRRA